MKKTLYLALLFLGILAVLTFNIYYWASRKTDDKRAVSQIVKLSDQTLSSSSKNDSTLSIMTYNIGYLSGMTNNLPVKQEKESHKQNLSFMKSFLKELKPDIVAFQEIDYGSHRSFDVDQEFELANSHYPYAARATNWDKEYVPYPYWPINVHFKKIISGQSLISKFEVKQQMIDTLARVESEPFYYKAFYLDRLAQICTLKFENKDILVINVHLEAFDQQTRIKHSEKVLELYENCSKRYPTILVGDFNSCPKEKNPTINTFLGKNINSAAMVEDGNFFTYPSDKPEMRLDYIFYSDHFEMLESRVVTEVGEVSDHLPVYAKFKLKDI